MRDINSHQVTITVELGDGTIVQKVQEFRGGNPRFHAKEADEAIAQASKGIQDGLAGMYGDVRAGKTA